MIREGKVVNLTSLQPMANMLGQPTIPTLQHTTDTERCMFERTANLLLLGQDRLPTAGPGLAPTPLQPTVGRIPWTTCLDVVNHHRLRQCVPQTRRDQGPDPTLRHRMECPGGINLAQGSRTRESQTKVP